MANAKKTKGIDEEIQARLKDTPEQKFVVGPVVKFLISRGWPLDQIQFGKGEWRVPTTPSEATKREKHQSFDGFPCDIAVFDSARYIGDYRHLVMIIECKQPDENAGLSQLETYLSMEPYTKLGVWANDGDKAAKCLFLFRKNGSLIQKSKIVRDLPSPGDPITPTHVKTTYDDLAAPRGDLLLRTFGRLLDRVVARDANVTRREDQLDQLCNLILLKLDSDKRAKATPGEEVQFRPKSSAMQTAKDIRSAFVEFTDLYPDLFHRKMISSCVFPSTAFMNAFPSSIDFILSILERKPSQRHFKC